MEHENHEQDIRREVKEFGDGGAHVTVPSEWVGDTVNIRRTNWDAEVGGEIQQVRGKDIVTIVEQGSETSRVAGPYARDCMTDSERYLLGLKGCTARTDESLVYGLSEETFSQHLPLFGRTGQGKTTVQVNLSWQFAHSDHPFRVIDLKGDLTQRIQNRLEIDCVSLTQSDQVTSLEVGDASTSLYDLSALVPNVQQKATRELLEQLGVMLSATESMELPVILNEFPFVIDAELVRDCRAAGVCLMPAIQDAGIYSSALMAALVEKGHTILFSMGSDELDALNHQFETPLPAEMLEQVSSLRPFEALVVSQTAETVTPLELFPQYPAEHAFPD